MKAIEAFNLDHLPSLRRDVLAHLATGTFVVKAENVILLVTTRWSASAFDGPWTRVQQTTPASPVSQHPLGRCRTSLVDLDAR